MTRHLVIFVVTFAIGAVVAVILRTGRHKAYAEQHASPTSTTDALGSHAGHAASASTAGDAPQIHGASSMPAPTLAEPSGHEGHDAMPMPETPSQLAAPPLPTPDHSDAAHHAIQAPTAPATPATAAVNTICPVCGMPVNPALPFADYNGKKIGFGCAGCPPKFRANPAKYGEAALKNQVAE